jgi:hypothetical protein
LAKARQKIRQFEEDKIRVEERVRLLGERENNLAQREAIWAKTLRLSKEQDAKSHKAKIAAEKAGRAAAEANKMAAEAREMAAEEDQTRTLKLNSRVEELRLEVAYEKAAREEEIQRNKTLELEKERLLGTIEVLNVELAAVKRQDSHPFTEPVISSKEEDKVEEKRLQGQVDECQDKLQAYKDVEEHSRKTLQERKDKLESHPTW